MGPGLIGPMGLGLIRPMSPYSQCAQGVLGPMGPEPTGPMGPSGPDTGLLVCFPKSGISAIFFPDFGIIATVPGSLALGSSAVVQSGSSIRVNRTD